MSKTIVSSILLLLIFACASASVAAPEDAASTALKAKDYAAAIKLATEALDTHDMSKSSTANLLIVRGKAHLALQENDAAVTDFSAAIDPDATVESVCDAFGDVFVSRGEAYEGLRRFHDAATDYKRALVCEPENAEIELDLGNAYFRYDPASAVGAYNDALKHRPGDQKVLTQRAKNYENMHEIDKALADYDEVLRLYPNDALTYNNRGTIFVTLGRMDQALTDFDHSITLDPKNFMAYLNRSNVEFLTKDYEAARNDLDLAKTFYNDPKFKSDFEKKSGPAFARLMEYNMATLDDMLTNAPP